MTCSGICPKCGGELELMASVAGSELVETPDAAVEIARIESQTAIRLAEIQAANSAVETSVLADVAEQAIEQEAVEAELDAEVALEQPELIGSAMAEVVEATEPDVTVITGDDSEVNAGDIEPLPDVESVEPVEDTEPKKQHWLQRPIGA